MAYFVVYQQDGAIVTLTLNNPDERNALSTQAQWDEIVDLCARIRADQRRQPLATCFQASASGLTEPMLTRGVAGQSLGGGNHRGGDGRIERRGRAVVEVNHGVGTNSRSRICLFRQGGNRYDAAVAQGIRKEGNRDCVTDTSQHATVGGSAWLYCRHAGARHPRRQQFAR